VLDCARMCYLSSAESLECPVYRENSAKFSVGIDNLENFSKLNINS